MKVRFNRGALEDINQILDFVAERNPKAAAKLLERFEGVVELIGNTPEIGTRTERSNLRKFVVGSYLLIYEIAPSEVIIHYVRHGARRRPWDSEQ